MKKSRPNFVFDPAAPVIRTHCHSAFGGPWPGLTAAEREEFVREIFASADFSSVKIVAFSVQPSFFDLILDVPRQLNLSKSEMLRRFKDYTDDMFIAVEGKRLDAGDPLAWARLTARFGDISQFIKNIKQRATHRYHRKHGTAGTLWGHRYTRSFTQPGHPSRVLAAWMDHAAVRRGEVATPDEDCFSTFGRAVSGDERARAMIAALHPQEVESPAWRSIAKAHREFISDDILPPNQRPNRDGEPMLTRRQFMLTEAPHFRGGVAFGDRDFVESVFTLNREDFGAKRTTGARRISGQCDPGLWTLRQKTDLRKLRD